MLPGMDLTQIERDPPTGTTVPVRSSAGSRAALRRAAVAVGGGLVVLVGVILLVLPGPGWAIIFAGLALLSTEFSWAGRALTWLRGRLMALSGRGLAQFRRLIGSFRAERT